MDSNIQKPNPASGAGKRVALHPPAFDTIQAVRHLKEAGFGEKQAMTIVESLRDVQSELATKSDLEKTEAALRSDVGKMEVALRGDMGKLEASIRGNMETMEVNIRSDMDGQFATLYWCLLLGASIITGILGTMITLSGAK